MLSTRNLQVSDNSNVKFNGDNNEGRVVHNSNLKLRVSNTKLDLTDNSNLVISGEHPSIKASGCSNTEVAGNGNQVDLKENSNTVLKGNGNQWVASENSNLDVLGNQVIACLFDNSNAKVEANDMTVVAERNNNLEIVGNGGNLIVKGTSNHFLKQVVGLNDSGNIQNVFAVIKHGKNVNFHIEFINKANIDRSSYNIGIYKFQIIKFARKTIKLIMDQSLVDSGTLRILLDREGEVIVSATINGVFQTLKVQGPRVEVENAQSGIINIKLDATGFRIGASLKKKLKS